MSVTDRVPSPLAWATGLQDESTRYLSAGVHMDPGFADTVIREFLTEPLRAIPPAPGVDTVAVLREAVAARRRRLLRDWSLIAVLIALLVTNPITGLTWFAVSVLLWALLSGGPGRMMRRTAQMVAGVVLIALVVVLILVLRVFSLVGQFASIGPSAIVPFATGPIVSASAVGLGLLALAIVLWDEFVLAQLLTRSFQRGQFEARPQRESWWGERWARTLNQGTYQHQLARIDNVDPDSNVVLYRDFEPFIGAGTRVRDFALGYAISLDPDDDSDIEQFTLAQLYDHVSTRLLELRDASSLAPSERLSGLTDEVQVIVPVRHLLVNFADPRTKDVLPGLNGFPAQRVGEERLAELIEQPLEWMRYYRCYRLQTWDRDVAVSAYLTFGISERTLYLEWTPCVLFPVTERYRVVDSMPPQPLGPLRSGLLDWLRLPALLLSRLGSLFTVLRPLPVRQGLVAPDRYGSAASVRELAVAEELNNYFQRSDVSRYLQVLTTRMTRAVGEFLEDRGISVTEFMRQTKDVINQTTVMGDMINSVIGDNNQTSGGSATQRRR